MSATTQLTREPMTAPLAFVEWINQNLGFNPRAGKYSVALSMLVFDDLVGAQPRLASPLLKPKPDADVTTLSATRNIDFVLWGPRDTPGELVPHIAVENKLILAAHGKARKNRLGDIIAFANHVHNADRKAIACGLIGINISPDYANPDPFAAGMTRHRFAMDKVVADTVAIYAKLPQRTALEEPYDRPEAFGVIVFSYDGKKKAQLVTAAPAPQPDSPLSYDTFIRRIVELYGQRRG